MWSQLCRAGRAIGPHEALHAALKANDVDDQAMQQVFYLCQKFGDRGTDAVQSLFMNLLKKIMII